MTPAPDRPGRRVAGYVRTADQVKAAQAALSAPRFVGQQLLIRFRTDPDVLAALLPPPLAPDRDPVAVASVGQWHSSCVGDYAGGSVTLSARHGSDAGGYPVGMWMDSEPSVVFGREVFGEPKKLATAGVTRDGTTAAGWIERNGTRLLELTAELGPDLGPVETTRLSFNYRARTAAGGAGLSGPAVLTRVTFAARVSARSTGSGTIALRSGPHDPVGEIPVHEALGAEYQFHDLRATCVPADEVPADTFLPYHLGRCDDWTRLDTLGRGSPR